jgi:hypothetical protein
MLALLGAPRRADKVIHKKLITKRQRRVCTVGIAADAPRVSQVLPNAVLGKQRIPKTPYFIGFLRGAQPPLILSNTQR